MWTSNFITSILLTSPLEGSPTLVGRGVSPFAVSRMIGKGGAGGWLTRFVILARLQVIELQSQPCHPPESTLLILPPSKGDFSPQMVEAQ